LFLLICFVALSASQCSRLHTSVRNGTGSDVYLRIYVGSQLKGYGPLAREASVNLTEHADQISMLVYSFSDRTCQMGRSQIDQSITGPVAHTDMTEVLLRGCKTA